MDLGSVSYIFKTSVMEIIMLTIPVLGISLVVGLIISIIQAATSVMDQTLTFVPKILAVLLTLVFLGTWMFSSMGEFTRHLFQMIAGMAR